MSKDTSLNLKFGFKRATTWNTAVALGANDGILLRPPTLARTQENQVDDRLGLYFSETSDPGLITVTGDIPTYLQFDGQDVLLAQLFGTVGGANISYTGDSSTLTTGTATGTSTSGSTTTLVDSGQTWTVDELIGKYVVCSAGTGIYQIRPITDNDATSITVATWTSPAADTVYTIYEFAPFDYGIATSGGASTLTDSTKTWTVNTHSANTRFIKILSGTGANQVRRIASNTATEITVSAAWTTQPDATSVYQISGGVAERTIVLAEHNNGLYGTFGVHFENSNTVKEYPSTKIGGISMTAAMGEPYLVTFNAISDEEKLDSSTNTDATMDNITYIETENRAIFRGSSTTFRLADQGGALTAIDINGINLNFNRNQANIMLLSSTDNVGDEPVNNAQPTGEVVLEFAQHTAATYDTEWNANTAKMADIVITGNTIAAVATAGSEVNSNSQARTATIEFPHLNPANVETPIGDGIIPQTVTYNLLGDTSDNSGLSISPYMRLKLIGTYGGDALQAGN
jgi:hypothetical protein